jgi:hypothetical protein
MKKNKHKTFRSARTPFREEHEKGSVEQQLEPLADVPESRTVPETTRTTRKERQFWAYEPEEEEAPAEPVPTLFTDEQEDEETHQEWLGIMLVKHCS